MNALFGFVSRFKFRLLAAGAIALTVWALWGLTADEIRHIVDRSVIHFFCAPGVLLLSQAGFRFLERKLPISRLRGWWYFIVPGLAAALTIGLREPYDVATGAAPAVKSYIDYISWLLGYAFATWGLWRGHERMAEAWADVKRGPPAAGRGGLMGLKGIFKSIGNVVLKAGAPILASAIPGGGLAMNLVKDAFGVDPEEEDEQIIASAIEADPDAAVKLRRIETAHVASLERLALERDRAFLGDRQDARGREVAVVQATGKRDHHLYALAWTVIAGFFGMMALMMFVEIPENVVGPINQLFGALAAGFGLVLAYFFGTSSNADANAEAARGGTSRWN